MYTDFFNIMFPCGRVLKLFKNAANVTSSSNPLQLVKNITLTVVDCCAPPTLRLGIHCVTAGALIATSIASPNRKTY